MKSSCIHISFIVMTIEIIVHTLKTTRVYNSDVRNAQNASNS